MRDEDVENMMKNLSNDAKSFRTAFEHLVSNGTIRKTSQEKAANALSRAFVGQTRQLLRQFQNSKKVDSSPGVVASAEAREIDKVKSDAALSPVVIPMGQKNALGTGHNLSSF
jgi:hypothetical protein